MCLKCAIPVRGRTLGSECLATALGEEAPAQEVAARAPAEGRRTLARIGLVVAALATILPWGRFGPGSGPFGAWSFDPLWSMVAAIAATTGLVLAVTQPMARERSRAWDLACLVTGLLVILGSALALARPPAFASPWLGPWIALIGGLLAVAGVVPALRPASEPERANV
jgi:asparagine N-glycosylation enzyme membrane subunit Stt3